MTDQELMQLARQARRQSYSPYSGFSVGAALLTREGRVYTGANVENAAYPSTSCAEHAAILSAVLAGERDFISIAVAGGKGDAEAECTPCGNCRQILREFCTPDMRILFTDGQGSYRVMTLRNLLPMSFGPEQLQE